MVSYQLEGSERRILLRRALWFTHAMVVMNVSSFVINNPSVTGVVMALNVFVWFVYGLILREDMRSMTRISKDVPLARRD